MSFNLNKLVQPECGAPNPLVAAAQQIAMRPSSAAMTSVAKLRHINNKPVDFTREFLQREVTPIAGTSKMLTDSTLGQLNSTTDRSQQQQRHRDLFMRPMMNYMSMTRAGHHLNLNLNHHQDQQQQQFNTLYRQRINSNSMAAPATAAAITTTTTTATATATATTTTVSAGDQLETKYRNDMISNSLDSNLDQGKLDDVEFWQSLSQMYLGPNTYNNIALRGKNIAREELASNETTIDNKAKDGEHSWADRSAEFLASAEGASSIKLNELDYIFDERNPLKDQFEDPFSEGLKRLKQGDIPSAALLFEAAVQKEPEKALAWRYLGTTQAQNEKDSLAIRALRKCLNLDKTDQEARLAISVSLVNETQHHEACKYLLEWLISHDQYKSINASLSDFHLLDSELLNDPFYMNSIAQKHYNYVRDKFVEAARMSPNNPDPEVQNSLGVLFNMRGEYDKAVDCFKAALSVRSDDSLLWNRLGATLANGSKSDEAVVAYRRALEISPGFLRSRYNLAISLIHLNLYDEAAKQLVQILNMQAAGKGSRNTQIRTRSITSTSIWNTLRTVATLLNQPELYPIIDGRDLARCNEAILKGANQATTGGGSSN